MAGKRETDKAEKLVENVGATLNWAMADAVDGDIAFVTGLMKENHNLAMAIAALLRRTAMPFSGPREVCRRTTQISN